MTRFLPDSAAALQPASSLLPFAKIRLILADLDGTLLDESGDIWDENIPAIIRSLERYGVLFALATGRAYRGVRDLIKRLPLKPRIPIVLYNGSVVFQPETGRLLRYATIAEEDACTLFRLGNEYAVTLLAYRWQVAGHSQTMLTGHAEEVVGCAPIELRAEKDFNGLPVDWLDEELPPRFEPCAVVVDCSGHARISILRERIAQLRSVDVTVSGTRFLEIRPAGTNKWAGLEFVLDYLQRSPDEVLALGDQENDLEMIIAAGLGIAVGNAPTVVAHAADYVTHFDRIRGVLEALRLVRQASRYGKSLARLQEPP